MDGLLERPAPNLEPGDVLVFADGREGVVTARLEVEAGPGPLVAMLEVLVYTTACVRPSRGLPAKREAGRPCPSFDSRLDWWIGWRPEIRASRTALRSSQAGHASAG